MKTDYEYIPRRLVRNNGEIRYEVNLVHPTNEMECLTVFRAIPSKENFRIIEERGKEKEGFFYGMCSEEKVDGLLKDLTDKFRTEDIMTKLGMNGDK